MKDASGTVWSKSATIYYSGGYWWPADILVTNNLDGTVTVTWTTPEPAFGAVQYGLKGTAVPPYYAEETAVGTSHSVALTGIEPSTEYKILINNNEVLTSIYYWPDVAGPLCPLDVNRDCRVNVLDLIAVRNRLFLSTNIGTNRYVDVNSDGKINVLDFILVRNGIYTMCDSSCVLPR